MGDATGRVKATYQDIRGRWVSQVFQGRAGNVLTIVSAYQVVTDTPGKGLTTAASQQQSFLLQAQDPIIAPRVAFRRDLEKYLQKCKSEGSDILLMGDFNEHIGLEPGSMQQLMDQVGLVDIMKAQHTQPLPATYARGHRCLDYALATPHVVNSVVKAGYEAFNARYPTDHRSYYVDFSTNDLFGINIQPLAKYEPRILRSNNPNQVTAYIKAKHKYLSDHNVFQRVMQLEHEGNRHQYAERIDKDVVAASLAAEQSIPHYDKPQWSMELSQTRKKVQILKKCVSMGRTGLENREVILREWQEIAPSEELPTTIRECTSLLREIRKLVHEIIKVSYAKREQEQKRMIEELESSSRKSDKEQALRIRRMQKAEALNRLFAKLRGLRLTKEKAGVTRIEIPTDPNIDPKVCQTWKQIDVPTDILRHLRERNRKHFGQAQGTPFTEPPLSTDLEFTGLGDASTSMLAGEYVFQGVDENVALVIEHLKQTEAVASLEHHTTITEDEYRGKLKVWRESTATSPSGLHLGHYKAMIARHKYADDSEDEDEEHQQKREELDRMQDDIFQVHLSLLNYALNRGYSYNRWQKVANSILFKEPGNIKIHRTRVIHLYEADYNLAIGIKWRSALYFAESNNLLNDGQYGSRHNKNAIDPVFIEELQFELSRLTRKTMVQTNYDATSCYDRIIPSLAMVTSQKYGVHKMVTAANARTLENARYHIRTDMGLSEESYSHSTRYPIYGTGQGSGNSPAIWCFLSSLLYDCYDTKAAKATYLTPNRSECVELGMVGFVDDSNGQTNLFESDESTDTKQQIVTQLKDNAQLWSDLLGVSGGALELTKCSYHVMSWQFTGQGSPVLVTDTSQRSAVTVRDYLSGEAHELQYLSPYAAHKTLGHYKEPAGTQKEQYRQLQKKSDQSVEFMKTCALTREEAWTYYYACYLPSIGYPLATSYFTRQQLDNIQRKAMSIIFAKCGYNRNTKRDILYGPLELGGANFRRLYDQQGIGQVQLFMRHWRQQSTAGRLLRCVVSWAQYCAGTSTPILEDVHQDMPHLESKWLCSLREYLAYINAGLQLDATGVAPSERQYDEFIMDRIIASRLFTKKDIRRLNYCRMYLGALTISDLTTATGRSLDKAKLNGAISLISSVSKWLTVNQEIPGRAEWALWKKANAIWSNPDGTLKQPLGEWYLSITNSRLIHFAYLHANTLYVRTSDGAYITNIRTQMNQFTEQGTVIPRAQIHPKATPVEVQGLENNQWILTHRATSRQVSLAQPLPRTFGEYILSLDPWEVDLLRHTELSHEPHTSCVALHNGFRAGSDGSEKFGTNGAFGWVIRNLEGHRVASGMGPSRGLVMNSYRAECSGMLAILRFLIRIAAYTDFFCTWAGTVGTDSQSMLDTLFGRDISSQNTMHEARSLPDELPPLDPMIPEWDLLTEIRNTLRGLPFVQLVYVKGHQDNDKSYRQLNQMAQMNVDADHMAGRYQTELGRAHAFALMSPTTGAHLIYPEGTLTARYVTNIRRRATSSQLQHYIKNKYGFEDNVMQSINWSAHGKSMQLFIKKRVHITKMVHECLPTLGRLNRFDKGHRTCPCCPCLTEDRDHVIKCGAASRQRWRDKLFQEINLFHDKAETYPLLRHLWNEAIQEWLRTDEPDILVSPELYHTDVREVIIQQNRIGWRQLINGRFGTAWSLIQEEYYRRLRQQTGKADRRSGETWQKQFIAKIWKQWEKLWKLRNEEVHGRDIETRAQAERHEIQRELREVYNNRNQMEPRIQELLYREEHQHMQRPLWVTRNWLATNAPVFRESMRRARTNATTGVRSIRSYFDPIR